ncbi:MAG TPA: hypothetical protein VGM91_16360 [Conexibacter sp.]|jgi:hypothetical protein
MSLDFEDRLADELVAAAQRRSAAATSRRRSRRLARSGSRAAARDGALAAPRGTARRGSHAPGRRRPLLAVTATLALVAVVAAITLPLLLHGAETAARQPQRTAALPHQCDPGKRRGITRVRLVSTPVDPRLLDAYAVLRRPQTAADRVVCPGLGGGGALNPSAIRSVGMDGAGHRVFLVPMAGTPDYDRTFSELQQRMRRQGRRAARRELLSFNPTKTRYLTGPRLCATIVYPNTSAGGTCFEPSYFGRGRFTPLARRPTVNISVGVFSDGISAVDVTFVNGTTRRIDVHNNVAVLTLDGNAPPDGVAHYSLIGDDGRIVATRYDGSLRITNLPNPPAAPPTAGTTPRLAGPG